jgi:acyl-CoA thioesterase-2
MHSMHGYFLRPLLSGQPITSHIEVIRDGRTVAARGARVEQGGKTAFTMQCSFIADTDGGYEYDQPSAVAVPARDDHNVAPGSGPWVADWVGPTAANDDGTRMSTHRKWFRIPAELPDDVHVHTALMAFASDWTGNGGRPLQLEKDTQGMISLDHAVWFHRPPRVDQWHFLDVHSLVNGGGRGVLRGTIFDEAGHVVASMAQEMLLSVV